MNLFARGILLLALCLLAIAPAAAAPAPAPDLMTKAFQLYQKGEYAKAAPLLEQHLAKKPDDPMAQYAMGLVQDKLGAYDLSLKHLRRAIELKPDLDQAKQAYAAVVQQRAYQLVDEGKLDAAVTVADEAIVLLPDEPGVHFARGAVLFERWRQSENPQDHLQALQSWNRCRELKPVSATGEILSGIGAFESGDFARAKEHFMVAQVMRPNNRYAAMWLGLALAASGEYDKSLEQLKNALEMFGRNPSLYRYIGDVYALQGNYPEAQKSYRQALALKPKDARVHATLGEIALATGQVKESLAEYGEATKARPDSFRYAFRLAELYRDAGEPDAALQAFANAARIVEGPSFEGNKVTGLALVNLERALLLLEKGDRDAAVQTFGGQEMHINRERNPRVYLYLAQVGTHEQRLDNIQKALKWTGPDARQLQAEAFLAWGDLQRSRKQRLDALEMYYQAWRRTPADSARTALIQNRFTTTKAEEIQAIDTRLGSLPWLIDPIKAASMGDALERRLGLVKKMELGPAGTLVAGATAPSTIPVSLVPAELEGELTANVQTATAKGADEVRVEPSWDQKK